MTGKQSTSPGFALRVFRFYRDGFKRMTVGKTLWKIIGIKVFILFAVLKYFFFPDFLATQFVNDSQRADYVMDQLTQPAQGYRPIPPKGEQL